MAAHPCSSNLFDAVLSASCGSALKSSVLRLSPESAAQLGPEFRLPAPLFCHNQLLTYLAASCQLRHRRIQPSPGKEEGWRLPR